jgi:plasmid stabilization system protein ParE
MNYEVVVQRSARHDIQAMHEWISEQAPVTADRWLDRLETAIKTLKQNPQRCPLAAECHRLSVDVHQLLFGKRPFVFRVLYVIDPPNVRVLCVRRAQRKALTTGDFKKLVSEDPDSAE